MIILLIIGIIAYLVDLARGGSSDSSSDYGDSYSNSNDTEERFENRWPYEYDKETGYTRSDYCHNGKWTDNVGNEYEQKTDCYGHVYYEKIDED